MSSFLVAQPHSNSPLFPYTSLAKMASLCSLNTLVLFCLWAFALAFLSAWNWIVNPIRAGTVFGFVWLYILKHLA